jgi:hypothetical protein
LALSYPIELAMGSWQANSQNGLEGGPLLDLLLTATTKLSARRHPC